MGEDSSLPVKSSGGDEEEPVPHAEERIRLLEEEIARLREAESLAASRSGPVGYCPPGVEAFDVEVHFKKMKRSVTVRENQGWAQLRKRLIRKFRLKGSRWELRKRHICAEGDGGWEVVDLPPRTIGEMDQYRIVVKKAKRQVPGVRDTTQGKPRATWRLGNQRQGGPATTTTGKRPEERPPGPETGIRIERAKGREVLLIEWNEVKKPGAT
jgi:hypothetical protein